MRQAKRKKEGASGKHTAITITLILLSILILLAAAGTWFLYEAGEKSGVTENAGFVRNVQAGLQSLSAKRAGLTFFSKEEAAEAEVTPSLFGDTSGQLQIEFSEAASLKTPGLYEVVLTDGNHSYHCYLRISDTTPPSVQIQNLTVESGTAAVAPESFLLAASDISAYTVSYLEVPDFALEGDQPVSILLTDAYGNMSQANATLTILTPDREPPVITGAQDQEVSIGDTVLYKAGVSAVDAIDGAVSLNVDVSAVNPTQEGTYPVTYTASDSAGNTATVTVSYTFVTPLPPEISEHLDNYTMTDEKLIALTEEVSSAILKDGMSEYDKAWAIYKWTRNSISYTGTSAKGDWQSAAVTGFSSRRGDCYTYFACAKALLLKAGFQTIDVEKIKKSGRSMHYWQLVNYESGDLGPGWYHFDSCPRSTGGTFFMWTDQQMLSYSAKYYNCFDFDLDLYPRTPGSIDYSQIKTYSSFTVVFQDWDGTVLKQQKVVSGDNAKAPENPVREGYTFTGWSGSYTSVKSNTTVTAVYQSNQPTEPTVEPTAPPETEPPVETTAPPETEAPPTTEPASEQP